MKRHGFTLVEIALASSLFALALGTIIGIQSWAGRTNSRTLAISESMRSVMMATDAVRRDVQQMCFHDAAADLRVSPDGRSIMLRLTHPEGDLWHNSYHPVTYYLEPVKQALGGYHLMRHDDRGLASVGGCVLADLFFKVSDGGNPGQFMLEMTCRGQSGDSAGPQYTASALIPVAVLAAPQGYHTGGAR